MVSLPQSPTTVLPTLIAGLHATLSLPMPVNEMADGCSGTSNSFQSDFSSLP